MPGPGELPPPRVMLCRTRELGDKDTISLRTLIDHAFYCYTATGLLPGPAAGSHGVTGFRSSSSAVPSSFPAESAAGPRPAGTQRAPPSSQRVQTTSGDRRRPGLVPGESRGEAEPAEQAGNGEMQAPGRLRVRQGRRGGQRRGARGTARAPHPTRKRRPWPCPRQRSRSGTSVRPACSPVGPGPVPGDSPR